MNECINLSQRDKILVAVGFNPRKRKTDNAKIPRSGIILNLTSNICPISLISETFRSILRRYAALLRGGAFISVGCTHGYQDCIPTECTSITNYELKITNVSQRITNESQ